MTSIDTALADWASFDADSPYGCCYEPVRLLSETVLFKPTIAFKTRFPMLTQLLNCSRRTILETSQGLRHIHAWSDHSGKRFGWVCLPGPNEAAKAKMHADHRLLLTAFGGIDTHWNGPPSFLSNQNGSLGIPHWSQGFGQGEDLFLELSEDLYPDYTDVEGDVVPSDYAKFTSEANGDMTLYHIQTSKVIHLGFDCVLREVTACDGYPGLLYHINGVPDFVSWVEKVADVWMSAVEKAT